jgi:hypothetical protein
VFVRRRAPQQRSGLAVVAVIALLLTVAALWVALRERLPGSGGTELDPSGVDQAASVRSSMTPAHSATTPAQSRPAPAGTPRSTS